MVVQPLLMGTDDNSPSLGAYRLLYLDFDSAGKEPRTTLIKGQLEGWARVRVAGQTDWKRLWVVISAGSPDYQPPTQAGQQSTLSLTRTNSHGSPSSHLPKKGRLSGLFSRSSHQHSNSTGSTGGPNPPMGDAPNMQFFTSPKPKDRKSPVLSVWSVSQAFAVYPERPDLITRSTLVKIEGRLGREEGAGAIKGTEAWVLIMPDVETGQSAGPRKMLEWVVGEYASCVWRTPVDGYSSIARRV
jgi:CCR4-NOT transcriptional complex subunit CAF120